jgi:ABC-type glycerol-3-phosphate transport system permease component
MPIISHIGRKHPKTRVLIASIYIALTLGAATMIYPFLLMISGSFKSFVDRQDWDVIPRYLHDDAMLYRKFIESKYNETLAHACMTHLQPYLSFGKLEPPQIVSERAVADYREFIETTEWRDDYRTLGFVFGSKMRPLNARLFIQHARAQAGSDIRRFNDRFGSTYEKWEQIHIGHERWPDRYYRPMEPPLGPLYQEVRATRPAYEFYLVSLQGDFLERQIYPKYSKFQIESVNSPYGTNFASFAELSLPARVPSHPAFAADWENYVRKLLHPRYVHVDGSASAAWIAFLREKYKTIEAFNRIHGTRHADWAEVPLAGEVRDSGARLADFTQFLEAEAPIEAVEIRGPDFLWREFLARKYHDDLEALRRAHGIEYRSFETAPMPAAACDWAELQTHRRAVMREFVVRNYAIVLDYVFRHGRALWNTMIYCALAIATALIINPLAAYALSRYQLPSQYKILFFLMATMAFPAEVTMIPGFLLLKDLNLLNTFWALVLPAAANGYAIFLLKGFFDSLPRELYESAQMDGASEWRMFWTITMSLSKPILAVIALGAFTAAYGAFMFALIVCQDERMWTIMVYLYQLQQNYAQPVVFASLLVVAVPTLLVFIFCQNIIMRGIVVPVEK